MTEIEHELQAVGISALRFLESLVTTDLQQPGVTVVREGEIVVPLRSNIPMRVELARYLLDMAMHYRSLDQTG